ncbi:hypothetical protein HX889_09200 [Pseudomonas reactans]|nr:hypothetical protein [Pseudomonas reactans]
MDLCTYKLDSSLCGYEYSQQLAMGSPLAYVPHVHEELGFILTLVIRVVPEEALMMGYPAISFF